MQARHVTLSLFLSLLIVASTSALAQKGATKAISVLTLVDANAKTVGGVLGFSPVKGLPVVALQYGTTFVKVAAKPYQFVDSISETVETAPIVYESANCTGIPYTYFSNFDRNLYLPPNTTFFENAAMVGTKIFVSDGSWQTPSGGFVIHSEQTSAGCSGNNSAFSSLIPMKLLVDLGTTFAFPLTMK
jgi:hypothetical protein